MQSGDLVLQDPWDGQCGTADTAQFHHQAATFCPGQQFLCQQAGPASSQFSRCMQAIGCKMNYEMRVEEDPNPLVSGKTQCAHCQPADLTEI